MLRKTPLLYPKGNKVCFTVSGYDFIYDVYYIEILQDNQ